MNSAALRVLQSPSQPEAHGFEVISEPLTCYELAETLKSVEWDKVAGSFVILRLSSTDHAGVEAAFKIAHEFASSSRICVAIDEATLARIDSRRLENDRIGLVLDDVDTNTSLPSIAHDGIEAIRFSPGFLEDVKSSLRKGAVMRALLRLAQDLGLGTLRPVKACDGHPDDPTLAFDYVPVDSSCEGASPPALRSKYEVRPAVRVS